MECVWCYLVCKIVQQSLFNVLVSESNKNFNLLPIKQLLFNNYYSNLIETAIKKDLRCCNHFFHTTTKKYLTCDVITKPYRCQRDKSVINSQIVLPILKNHKENGRNEYKYRYSRNQVQQNLSYKT